MMGVRLFAENMFLEEYYSCGAKISDSVDVTNRIEFVQYLNTMDKRPAHQGGRNNEWRELSVTRSTPPPGHYHDGVVIPTGIGDGFAFGPGVGGSGGGAMGLEEDFGHLFEWTNRLSLEALEDYVVAGGSGRDADVV
ncbi:hypothetical protein HDV00_004928 [Rhizophlyctis rosea]|nr:hypothetical protein HDV00_004928 [Rhizophlyctis rosea]